jgi:hypothetical protein
MSKVLLVARYHITVSDILVPHRRSQLEHELEMYERIGTKEKYKLSIHYKNSFTKI